MTENPINILIVAVESDSRTDLKNAVHLSGYNVETTLVDNIATAIYTCKNQRFDCIFLDRNLPLNAFVDFMDQLYNFDTKAAVCMMLNTSDHDSVEEAFNHGALDTINIHNITLKDVTACIQHSLDYRSTGASGY
ncbi:MAG: response regulator [Bacteroidia bacterium]|nr:response regulator [Bacteroidia bacterium]